jgi:hypothetical protein
VVVESVPVIDPHTGSMLMNLLYAATVGALSTLAYYRISPRASWLVIGLGLIVGAIVVI